VQLLAFADQVAVCAVVLTELVLGNDLEPALGAEVLFVLEQLQFVVDVVHDQHGVYARTRLEPAFAEFEHLETAEAFARVQGEHVVQQFAQFVRVDVVDLLLLALLDFVEQVLKTHFGVLGGLERRVQLAQLVDQTAERPHVRLLVVAVFIQHFWTHLEGRADFGARLHGLRGQETPQP